MKPSAGILLFRRRDQLEVFLVHPGGPYWAKKDDGAWTIPKGEYQPDEEPAAAAVREFNEETGHWLEAADLHALGSVTQRSGKVVSAWAVEGDLDPDRLESNDFTIEWPPRSGRSQSFPEVDRGEWFSIEAARVKLNPAQTLLLDRLIQLTN